MNNLLNQVITVYGHGRVSDGQGGWIVSDSSTDTKRGRIRPASGGERVQADQEQGFVTHIAYFRYGTVVKAGFHLEDGDLRVKVLAVRNPGSMNRHLELNCTEVQNEL